MSEIPVPEYVSGEVLGILDTFHLHGYLRVAKAELDQFYLRSTGGLNLAYTKLPGLQEQTYGDANQGDR
ncbi:MAG TPA: hypothetical protein VKJ47_06340 [Candidatus Binatia bacterium]|nr:hypothetical protein [Candidatus Binatia bacterium]